MKDAISIVGDIEKSIEAEVKSVYSIYPLEEALRTRQMHNHPI